MHSSQKLALYPKPEEGPITPYNVQPEGNPVLRGWLLVAGSRLISSSDYVAGLFWKNAHFGDVKDLPGLDKYQYRYQPTVIPVADGAVSATAELGPELHERQPDGLPGRYYSVADYHAVYKAGQVTPLQVFRALLPVIRRGKTPAAKYASAFVHSDEDRIIAAAKASTERYATGKYLSILDGVPFGVKDDTDVEGYISHWGLAYNPNVPFFHPAEKTSEPVQHLLDAGAIMIGKQVQQELGTDCAGSNPHWGSPTNWYNKSYYTGGSSAGAGSALGAGLVPISIGTDSGGSIRIPPAFNGVYGLKGTHNRTCTMTSTMCVTGPMASNVTDLTVAYRLMALPNADDPVQSLFATSIPPSPSAKKVMGIYKDWFYDASPAVVEACEKAVNYLVTKHDYEVVDIAIPYMREGQLAHAVLCIAEPADAQRTRTPNPSDCLSLVNSVNKALLSIGAQTSMIDHAKYNQLRELHMRHLAFLFQKYPGLLIVTPTVPNAGWKIHPGDEAYGFSDGDSSVMSMKYCWLANWTGCPAVNVPVGYVEPEQGEGKLPVSLMAMGEWGAEEQLLAWAGHTEAYLHGEYPGGRIRPKDWADVIDMARKTSQVDEL